MHTIEPHKIVMVWVRSQETSGGGLDLGLLASLSAQVRGDRPGRRSLPQLKFERATTEYWALSCQDRSPPSTPGGNAGH